jgi:uncharacterized coiled-coil DUF342 family protein
MSAEGFWLDAEQSRKIVKELKNLKSVVEPWEQAYKKHQELIELVPLLKEDDKELVLDLTQNIDALGGPAR